MGNEIIKTTERAREYFEGYMAQIARQAEDDMDGMVIFFVLLGIGLAVFYLPIYKHILRRREVYTLTNHKLDMRYGIIAKTTRHIPLAKIQDVTVKASVWQRLLKLGDIEIDSASETGKIVLDEAVLLKWITEAVRKAIT